MQRIVLRTCAAMNLGLMKEFPVTMPLLAFSRILQAVTSSQKKPDACLLHCCGF